MKDRVARYESIALDVYGEMGIETLPLFDATDQEEYLTTMLDKDNLHPNSDGHQWVYERVRPKVVEMRGTIDEDSPFRPR